MLCEDAGCSLLVTSGIGTGAGGGGSGVWRVACCEFISETDNWFRGERAQHPCLRTSSPRVKGPETGRRKDSTVAGGGRRGLLQVMGLTQWVGMVGGWDEPRDRAERVASGDGCAWQSQESIQPICAMRLVAGCCGLLGFRQWS